MTRNMGQERRRMEKRDYEERIQALLKQMTVEEKAGQLRQCGPSLVGAFEVSFEELLNMMFDGRISQEEFGKLMSTAKQDYREEDLRAGKIGSYNGIKDAQVVNRLQKIAVEETRLGIPLLFGYDVIHGYRTVYPIPLAESCAWDPKLWEKTGRMAAEEATAGGVHMTFAPMVDVAKDARWGRVSEGAGEDSYINSLYGAAKVKGFQGDDLTKEDAMVACVKHFAGYGAGEAGRDYNRVDMSMQRFYEEYLPPYKACIDAGARAIMPAFNDLWGVPCSVNSWLLMDILRKEWGFDGLTVSDSNAIAECVGHGIAKDRPDAAVQAIYAGMDLDMSSDVYHETLPELVNSGKVSMEALDRAVADVLRLKFELGLFENPYKTSPEREAAAYLSPEHRSLARESAVKSMVLLKNDKALLPLDKNAKVGVIGSLAKERAEMLGAWAIGADGEACVSLVDALEAKQISYEYFENAEAAADFEGVIIAAVGERKDMSGEAASRACIELPKDQEDILKALVSAGKTVVAVLFNGRPLAMPWVAENVPAILEAWHPGVEAGNAITDVLFGDANPSGHLTVTFPGASGQCPMYYAHINTGRPGGRGKFTSKYLDAPIEPVYPFGYGLSYTEFEYSDLKVTPGEDCLEVCVTVKNTGSRTGATVIQCYFRDLVAKRVRPVKQLADFEKVTLEPGEAVQAAFNVEYSSLGYYDLNMNYVLEDGEFEIFVGQSSADCLSEKVSLTF